MRSPSPAKTPHNSWRAEQPRRSSSGQHTGGPRQGHVFPKLRMCGPGRGVWDMCPRTNEGGHHRLSVPTLLLCRCGSRSQASAAGLPARRPPGALLPAHVLPSCAPEPPTPSHAVWASHGERGHGPGTVPAPPPRGEGRGPMCGLAAALVAAWGLPPHRRLGARALGVGAPPAPPDARCHRLK